MLFLQMKKEQLLGNLYTATLGSFPLSNTPENMARCLDDMVKIGIDLPNYPQLEGIFDQFASDDYTEPFRFTLDYLKKSGLMQRFVGIQACVIGPLTLANRRTRVVYENQVFPDIHFVREEAEKTAEFCSSFIAEGADIIRIDEPQLGLVVGKDIHLSDMNKIITIREDHLVEIYDGILKCFPDVVTGIHVCGDISPKLADTLLQTKFDYLNHEFSSKPRNIEFYSGSALESANKLIMAGVVSSSDEAIEPVSTIEDRIRKVGANFGYQNLILSPDCGFKPLRTYSTAIEKLKRMCQAVKNIRLYG
jgi:methionine synthase II (cobalamin-independent)